MLRSEKKEEVAKIKINTAKIVTGTYSWCHVAGKYKLVNSLGKDKNLQIDFELDKNTAKNMSVIYITQILPDGNAGPADYQHITNYNQREFFFPLPEDCFLEKLRVVATSVERIASSLDGTLFKRKVIAMSPSIFDCIIESLESRNSEKPPSLAKQNIFAKLPDESSKPAINAIPQAFFDIMTEEVFKKPVFCTLDDRTYEEDKIVEWLTKNRTSPHTRVAMKEGQLVSDVLFPNRNLADAIEEFRQQNPGLFVQPASPARAGSP